MAVHTGISQHGLAWVLVSSTVVLFVALVFALEAPPEELAFRGYIQANLAERLGSARIEVLGQPGSAMVRRRIHKEILYIRTVESALLMSGSGKRPKSAGTIFNP